MSFCHIQMNVILGAYVTEKNVRLNIDWFCVTASQAYVHTWCINSAIMTAIRF